MVTALAAALLFSCMPAEPPMRPPPVTVACEGTDRVVRNHDGMELRRAVNACTVASCEGWDFVVRTRDGQTLHRVSSARRCLPSVTPVATTDPLRFGLSYR